MSFIRMRGRSVGVAAFAVGAAVACCVCSCSSSLLAAGKKQVPPAATIAPSDGKGASGGGAKRPASPPGKAPALKAAPCPSFARRANGLAPGITDQQVAKAKAMVPQNDVFMGDSITHALESIDINKYKQQLGAVEVYAVPADLVDDLAWRLCQAFPPAKTFVVMIGTNNTPAEDPGAKIIDLVKYIRARSRTANIVVLGIFWRSDPAARAKGQSANAAVKKFIAGARDKRMIYSDAGVALPPSVFPDGLHPDAAGWGIVLDKILPLLAKLN